MNRRKLRKPVLILIAVLIVINGFAISALGKTYYKVIGNWQGWFDYLSGASVDGDTYRVKVKFGYKHEDGTLYKYSYTGHLSSSAYKEAVSNVTATPAVPDAGKEATIGTGYIDLKKQHEAKTVTITAYIKNNTTGSTTESKTFTVTIPAKTSYAVSYSAGEGTSAPGNQTKWYGETLTLTSKIPIRTGYSFEGWAKSSDPDTVICQPGAKYSSNAALTLVAVWKEIKLTDAEIFVTKTLLGGISSEAFRFTIVPDSGWTNDAVSTFDNGRSLKASELPLPEGSDSVSRSKTIAISGFTTANNNTVTASLGNISFSEPGWYMYKVCEEIPVNRTSGIKYDTTSYYVVVYVARGGAGIVVKNVTAWHNNTGSGRNKPNLEDISMYPDSEEGVQANTEPRILGKTDVGERSCEVRFWNRQETSSLRIQKNVTGSLGDRIKQFEFKLSLENLGDTVTYKMLLDGAKVISGAEEDGTFTSGRDGRANLLLAVADDESIEIEGLPVGAKYSVREEACNHVASYSIRENDTEVAHSSNSNEWEAIQTPSYQMKVNTSAVVMFENDRSIAVMTDTERSNSIVFLLILTIAIVIAIVYVTHRTMRGGSDV